MSLVLDVNEVKIRADNALKSDVDEARLMYQQYIMDWTDYHNETKDTRNDDENVDVVNKITEVWILSANMEISLKQFKKATAIFDNALNDDIANTSVVLYNAYADYYKSRNKPAKAQDVYIKGICCHSIKQEDIDSLWISLLSLIKENDGYITMKELFEEVKGTLVKELENENHTVMTLKSPSQHLLDDIKYNRSVSDNSGSTNNYDNSGDIGVSESKADSNESIYSATIKVESKASTQISTVYDEWDNILGLTPEILRRVHHNRAPMIFSAPNQEPMVLGLNCINDDEANELDKYLGTRLRQLDRSGLASAEKLSSILDVLEALWTIQALKERQFESWFIDLNKRHEKEGADINRILAEREAKGDTRTSIDRKRFQNRCNVQKEVLISIVNKTMYSLLLDQCRVLNELKFPRCSNDMIERIEANNNKCLNSNELNSYDKDLTQAINTLQRYCCSLLSFRIDNYATPALKRGYIDDAISNNDNMTKKRRKQDDSNTETSSRFNNIPPAPVLTIPTTYR